MNIKRVIVCVLLGCAAGLFCWWGGTQAGMVFTKRMVLGAVLNRSLIGFVIGISGWKKINPLLHGAIIGIIVSSLMAVYAPLQGAIMVTIFGAVFGIVIELVATTWLKLKA